MESGKWKMKFGQQPNFPFSIFNFPLFTGRLFFYFQSGVLRVESEVTGFSAVFSESAFLRLKYEIQSNDCSTLHS